MRGVDWAAHDARAEQRGQLKRNNDVIATGAPPLGGNTRVPARLIQAFMRLSGQVHAARQQRGSSERVVVVVDSRLGGAQTEAWRVLRMRRRHQENARQHN